MSKHAVTLALGLKLKGSAKAVLNVLAYHHNEGTGRCFPKHSLIASECGQSVPTVRRNLRKLEADGIIKREANERDDGGCTSNEYALLFLTPDQDDHTTDHQDHPPDHPDTRPPDQNDHAPDQHEGDMKGKLKGRKEEKGKNSGRVTAATRPIIDDPFDRFWPIYPKRDGNNPRKTAKQNFEKAVRNGADPEDIIAGTKRYREIMERQSKINTPYVQRADAWLNQESWKRDDAPASNVIQMKRYWADVDSPQWTAWNTYLKKRNSLASQTDGHPDGEGTRLRRGWYFESEFPPGYKPPALIAA